MRAVGMRRPVVGEMQRRHKPDYILLVICVALLLVGLIVVFAISPALAAQKNVAENYYVQKQLIAVALSVVAFLVVAHMPIKSWRHLEKPLLIAAGVSALAVRIFGEEVNGAYRWIQVGGLSFQAAELIKFALLIWLAGYLSNKIRRGTLDHPDTIKPLLVALGAVGVVVAGLQSDLGSAAVMVAIMAAMAFVAGLPMQRIMMIGAAIVVLVGLAISTSAYRRERLQTFLNPAQDCQAQGYQACQALIAVGSGGMFGLGLARSVQAYGYLPEAANDSIFAIFAEKFGFVGTTLLVGAFVAMFARLVRIVEHTPDEYTRLIVVGILAWLSSQAMINMGAMLGLLPLKGITLPFISYGGTSLIFEMAAVALAFSVSRYTTYGRVSAQVQEGVSNDYSASRRGDRRTYNAPVSRRPGA